MSLCPSLSSVGVGISICARVIAEGVYLVDFDNLLITASYLRP